MTLTREPRTETERAHPVCHFRLSLPLAGIRRSAGRRAPWHVQQVPSSCELPVAPLGTAENVAQAALSAPDPLLRRPASWASLRRR